MRFWLALKVPVVVHSSSPKLARPAERELDTAVTNITCLDVLAVIAVGGRRERHEEGLILRIGLVDRSFETQTVAGTNLPRYPSFP